MKKKKKSSIGDAIDKRPHGKSSAGKAHWSIRGRHRCATPSCNNLCGPSVTYCWRCRRDAG